MPNLTIYLLKSKGISILKELVANLACCRECNLSYVYVDPTVISVTFMNGSHCNCVAVGDWEAAGAGQFSTFMSMQMNPF